MKKVFCALVLVITIFAGSVFAANPQDALSLKNEDSVYIALGLSDTGGLSRWLLAQTDAFMPLILMSDSSNEIIEVIEIARGIVQNTPLKSVALVIGANKNDPSEPFFQMAFTVDDIMLSTVNKIKDGSAKDSDIAKLLLGSDSPILSIAETMIKTEVDSDKVYTVDNVIKLKAVEDLIVLGFSDNDLKAALNAIDVENARLFFNTGRKFETEDFAFLHADFETLKKFDEDGDTEDITKYFDKPLNIELGFKLFPEKFTASLAFNLREAIKKEYAAKVFKYVMNPVKGCNINLENAGGSTSPLFAMGAVLNVETILEEDNAKEAWKEIAKAAQQFLGVTEAELLSLLNGAFSIVVNDSINVELFKIPALYASFAGEEGSAAKVFERLKASKFFSRIQDKILQFDSSISPVSCFVTNKNDALGINIAELTSLNETPQPSEALSELIGHVGISALWIDFAGIQTWIAENKIMDVVNLMAKMSGPEYAKVAEAVSSILSAKFSVPSFALWAETDEVVHLEFALRNDVAPEDGILPRVVKIIQDYMPKPVESSEEPAE